MSSYRVKWEIDVDADSPELAAHEAYAIQRDPDSIATCFAVIDPEGALTEVDVAERDDLFTPNTRPTVAQVVESAYGWANGDVAAGTLVPADGACGYACGDGLQAFLFRELGPEAVSEATELDSWEHWQVALGRCAQALKEVQSVYDALVRYAPREA